MFQKLFVFFTILWRGYYAKIVPNHDNKSEEFLITGGYVPKVHTHAKYAVSIADLRYFNLKDERKFGKGHFCTGSIIAPQTILTAAHCLKNKQPKNLVAIAGTPVRTKKVKSTQILRVKEMLPHPQFSNRIDSPHDIALLHLRDKIVEDHHTAQRMELAPASALIPNETCLHVGWGKLGHNGETADAIQYVDLAVFPQDVCDRKLGMKIEKLFCAGDLLRRVRAGCPGDSGGPLFCRDRLYGVDVMNRNCSKPGPTYFTDVSKYLHWIRMNSIGIADFRTSGLSALRDNIPLKISIVIIFVVLAAKII